MSEPEVLEEQNFPRAGLFRRLAALIYDMFLVAAIWMLLGFIFQQIFGIENQVIDGRVMTDPVADNLLFILMVLSCFTFLQLVLDAQWTNSWHVGLAYQS